LAMSPPAKRQNGPKFLTGGKSSAHPTPSKAPGAQHKLTKELFIGVLRLRLRATAKRFYLARPDGSIRDENERGSLGSIAGGLEKD